MLPKTISVTPLHRGEINTIGGVPATRADPQLWVEVRPRYSGRVTSKIKLTKNSGNQPRPMAAEATDEDDEEAHAFYHHTHPPGYGG